MKLIPRAGLLVVLALAITAMEAQSASAVIHPDSTALTASATDWTLSYGFFNISCNTATIKGSTGVSSSSVSGSLTLSNSPAGCTNNIGVSCLPPGGTVTITFTASTATGGTGTFSTSNPTTISCGGLCLITFPAQGPLGTVTYTNATGNANLNITTLSATRSGAGGMLCGPASGNATLKATFIAVPKVQVV